MERSNGGWTRDLWRSKGITYFISLSHLHRKMTRYCFPTFLMVIASLIFMTVSMEMNMKPLPQRELISSLKINRKVRQVGGEGLGETIEGEVVEKVLTPEELIKRAIAADLKAREEELVRREEELVRRAEAAKIAKATHDKAVAEELKRREEEAVRRAEELKRREEEELRRAAADKIIQGEKELEKERIAEELKKRAEEEIAREEELKRRDEELIRREEEELRRAAADTKILGEAELANRRIADELKKRAEEEIAREEELKRREEESIRRDEELKRREDAEIALGIGPEETEVKGLEREIAPIATRTPIRRGGAPNRKGNSPVRREGGSTIRTNAPVRKNGAGSIRRTDASTGRESDSEIQPHTSIRRKSSSNKRTNTPGRTDGAAPFARDAIIEIGTRRQELSEKGLGRHGPVLRKEEVAVSRFERDAGDRPFGKRPFGPISKFNSTPAPNLKWISYFFEESLAVTLQNTENVMMDCTILELSAPEEQRLALETFGSLMELVPLSLLDMIHLTSLCGRLTRNKVNPDDDITYRERNAEESKDQTVNPFSWAIFPGTLWCGSKDRADRYEHLGERKDLDNCCRTHDHCPIKLNSFSQNYGLANFGFGSKSHCLCEEEFYRCLKKIDDGTSNMIGNFYFNILRLKCIQGPIESYEKYQNLPYSANNVSNPKKNLYECHYRDVNNKCRYWAKNDVGYNMKLSEFYLKY